VVDGRGVLQARRVTYEEAVAWLYGLQPRGIRLELDRMRAACALRSDPQSGLPVVHVAGTNGKGSTCAMIESGLRHAGRRTGLYTSPHLHSFTERVRIAGEPISRDEVARRAGSIRRTLEQAGAPELTFFEVTTLLALEAFRDARCDDVVLEVGLGGRLDATNVALGKLACAITGIALDHQSYLGTTIREIAAEKAGILEAGVPLVLGPVPPGARAVIEARAAELGCRVLGPIAERAGRALCVAGVLDGLVPALAGAHQDANAAVAATVLDLIGVPHASIRAGIADVRWPGRLERIGPALLDAAHNPDGAASLAQHLGSLPRDGPRVLVFGAMGDKDWRGMLELLAPQIDRVIAVAPAMPRAERAEVIAAHAAGEAASSIRDGVDRARALAGVRGLVVIAGSIFVLADARAHLLGIESEPPIPM
jgi:dihydrofolate synthase/folylpolyglutamate synthase